MMQVLEKPYQDLEIVFKEALDQASKGKGQERHVYFDDEKYKDQLICEMDRRLDGNAIGPRYQAVKKIYESARMEPEKAIRELLGAINYIAAAVILLKEQNRPKQESEVTFYQGYITSPEQSDNTRKVQKYLVHTNYNENHDQSDQPA